MKLSFPVVVDVHVVLLIIKIISLCSKEERIVFLNCFLSVSMGPQQDGGAKYQCVMLKSHQE